MGVEQFARVRQAGVYDGIDLDYYGNQQRLEYDFVVAPGADPATIRLRFDGAERVEIDGRGDLLVHVPGGEPLRQHAPISYQQIDGTRREVESRYVMLGAQRRRRSPSAPTIAAEPLTIDPVLIYSSFFGGTGESRPSTSRSIPSATSTSPARPSAAARCRSRRARFRRAAGPERRVRGQVQRRRAPR